MRFQEERNLFFRFIKCGYFIQVNDFVFHFYFCEQRLCKEQPNGLRYRQRGKNFSCQSFMHPLSGARVVGRRDFLIEFYSYI